MTTLNTIIEEEKKEFYTFLASGDPIIGISDEQRDWIFSYITTVIQRVREETIEEERLNMRESSDAIKQDIAGNLVSVNRTPWIRD